jgi:hypothetical protein
VSNNFDGMKVFSATKMAERENLGEKITEWLKIQKGHITIVDKIVTQSSDSEFHCVTITLFYTGQAVSVSTAAHSPSTRFAARG